MIHELFATPEQMFSYLKRLKTHLRNSMAEAYISCLSLMRESLLSR